MRAVAISLLLLAACDRNEGGARPEVTPASVSFDGADYKTDGARLAHGKRMATMFGCAGCHGTDYSGQNFGEMIPIVKGLWASNISRVMPAMTDAQLETLLRTGVHPNREIYVMPSKQTQFLSDPDLKALIAYLRTIPPTGDMTPLPPEGFEAAVTARLPDDYWRTQQEGVKRGYHNAAEEVAYFASHRPAELGPQFERGRMIASAVCSSCHGAELDAVGEPAGNIQRALKYSDAEFDRLLSTSVNRDGKKVAVEWGFGHEAFPLTKRERADAIAYTRALARSREPR